MTNRQADSVCDEIHRRAFDRAYNWALEEIFNPVYESEEFQKHDSPEAVITTPEQSALMDAAYKAAEDSGELDQLMDADGEIYTNAVKREEAEYFFHLISAQCDDDDLSDHFEFLKGFGITPENIDDQDDEEVVTE